MEQRLRRLDSRGDKLATLTETQEQRIDILAKMSSPENLRRDLILPSSHWLQEDVTHYAWNIACHSPFVAF